MRKGDLDELVKYRFERAKNTFEEANLMAKENHWNACVNRLYYACFYSVSALLAKNGMSSSKHTGIKSLFNQHWIKTGKIMKSYGRLYNNLFENRQEGDYIDFVVFKKQSVEHLIPEVKDFINALEKLIASE